MSECGTSPFTSRAWYQLFNSALSYEAFPNTNCEEIMRYYLIHSRLIKRLFLSLFLHY